MTTKTDELIVFVDKFGEPTGEIGPKLESHHAKTKIHRAFSCYVFDEKGRVLVTQRAYVKKVWPGVWTNTVCGHPMPGEETIDAIKRRLDYELGMAAGEFKLLKADYTYKTPPFDGIIEHEFCPIYAAVATLQPKPNPDEVQAFQWISWQEYIGAAEADGPGDGGHLDWMSGVPRGEARKLGIWSYWCKDQLKNLKAKPYIKKITSV